jgi:outer membrane protein OmpA-like peptidoglycan-associated protein
LPLATDVTAALGGAQTMFDTRLTGFRRFAGAVSLAALFAAGASLATASSASAQDRHFHGRGFAGHGFVGHGFYGHGFYGRGVYGPRGWYGPGWRGYGFAYYGGPYLYAPYYYAPYAYTYRYVAPATVYVPPPQAAVAPQREHFTVYFEFDRYDLTPEAQRVVDRAIAMARSGGGARLEVVGNTDLAGTGRYNQVLSRRRADAVRAYMVAQGVDPGAITVQALGKTDPALPTADGIREPRNRRVEIYITPLRGNRPPATSMRRPYSYGGPVAPANAGMSSYPPPSPYGAPPNGGMGPAPAQPTNLIDQ